MEKENRNKTIKRGAMFDDSGNITQEILEESIREAYNRPWHRLERGLRLNRIRNYIESSSVEYSLTPEEKTEIFGFLQKILDKKMLNTSKIVIYDTETMNIEKIIGFEIKKYPDGKTKWGFSVKKTRIDTTRKKKIDAKIGQSK